MLEEVIRRGINGPFADQLQIRLLVLYHGIGEEKKATALLDQVQFDHLMYVNSVLPVICLRLMEMKLFDRAEPCLRELLEYRKKAVPGQWPDSSARAMLGVALAGQEKWEEGGALLDRGLSRAGKA